MIFQCWLVIVPLVALVTSLHVHAQPQGQQASNRDNLLRMYWAKPNAKAVAALQAMSDPKVDKQIEKVKLHWRIQSSLEDCVLKKSQSGELKNRILRGVQGATKWKTPCPAEPLSGLDGLQNASHAIAYSAEKSALDKVRLSFLEEMTYARQVLGDEEGLDDFNKFCSDHACPRGAHDLIQKNKSPKVVDTSNLANRAWSALENYRSGKYIGSHEGLLLASSIHKIDLNSKTTFEEFRKRVPEAQKEVIGKLKSDTFELFKKVALEETSAQPPTLVRNHLRELIQNYPTVVGSMLANNPELTTLICFELQTMEGPKSPQELEKDWLWLGGGLLISAGAVVAAPFLGVPVTVGRMAQGALAATALKGAADEQAQSRDLLRESVELRNEFFSGSGDVAVLASADAKAQEAYEKMQSSYLEAAQVLPLGKVATMAKAFAIGKQGERSLETMKALTSFFNQTKLKAANKVFKENFDLITNSLTGSLNEFDLLMGTMAKLGPGVQKVWFRFFERLPDHAKERIEKLMAVARRKGCFL